MTTMFIDYPSKTPAQWRQEHAARLQALGATENRAVNGPGIGGQFTPAQTAEMERRFAAGESGSDVAVAMGLLRQSVNGKRREWLERRHAPATSQRPAPQPTISRVGTEKAGIGSTNRQMPVSGVRAG